MNYSEFEAQAVTVKEAETEIFRAKAEIAALASDNGAGRILAHLWGCSKQYITTLSRVWSEFPEDRITPDVPLSLYRAALETDAPSQWLKRALDEGWSARDLRDAADITKGRRTSRVALMNHKAHVVAWEGGTVDGYPVARIELDVPDFEPAGRVPEYVRVKAWEVLTL